jgi:hypothetical protein
MKKSFNITHVSLFAFVVIGALPVKAQIIVEDLFNQAPDGGITALSGKAPNTNTPGNTWSVQGSGFTAEQASNSFLGSQFLTGAPSTPVTYGTVNGDAATLGLGSSNSGVLTLSVYLNDAAGGDASLGFSNVAIGTAGLQFTGFSIDHAGDLTETANGVTSAAIAFGGTFDPSGLSLLSFTVDTASGAVTSVSFQNSTADYSSLLGGTAFTSAATAYIDLKASTMGQYADLKLSATESAPEPSTWALMIGGLVVLGGITRLRRESRN